MSETIGAPIVAPAMPPSEEAPRAHAGESRALTRLMTLTLVGYLLLIVALMFVSRAYVTPDLFLVFAGVVAVVLGRTRLFLRDWLPFVAILLMWEAARGLTANLAGRVHSDGIIAIERALHFGVVPTVELQRLLYRDGSVNVFDVAGSAVYVGHFLLPLAAGFYLWVRSRRMYYQYVAALLLLALAGFLTSLALPVAPPRFAAQFGEALAAHDVVKETLLKLDWLPVSTWIYGNLNGNPVAAMPSLHAAFPFLAYLFVRQISARWGWFLLFYSVVVWFSIVYLAHHYLIDVYAGLGYTLVVYFSRGWATRGRFILRARVPIGRSPLANVWRRNEPGRSQERREQRLLAGSVAKQPFLPRQSAVVGETTGAEVAPADTGGHPLQRR